MSRGRKTNLRVRLTPNERDVLESWQRSTSIRAGLTRRGRIILMLANGESISHISRTVGIRRRFVYKWAARFLDENIAGLTDKPGRGRNSAASTKPNDQPLAKPIYHEAELVGAGDDVGN
ncbi:MAG: helix-turn-helix domain-containing protein [Chloroflexi bacterium]|nr:helix-turn-helix domain-containing protein [Chloroflexota bacterium]